MDLEIIILSEVSQTEKDEYDIAYMQNLKKKKDANELIYKAAIDPQTQETNLWLPKGKEEGGINQEFGINIYTLLHVKQVTNKDLLYSTGNYTIL